MSSVTRNLIRYGYYFSDNLLTPNGKKFKFNEIQKFLYYDFRGFMGEYFTLGEMYSFIYITLINYLKIKIINKTEWLAQYNIKNCEYIIDLEKNTDEKFKNILFQKFNKDETINNYSVKRLKFNHEMNTFSISPIIKCELNEVELRSKLNLFDFVKYINDNHGIGIAELLTKQIINAVNVVSHHLYCSKIYIDFNDLLEAIIPLPVDYIVYKNIVDYISKPISIASRKFLPLGRPDKLSPNNKYIKIIENDDADGNQSNNKRCK